MCQRGEVTTTIDAARVLGPQGWTGPARIAVADGRIVSVDNVRRVQGAAGDRVLVPGFVDLQVNGIGSLSVAHAEGSDWEILDRRLLEQGVTAWCPTLITMPLGAYAAPLHRIAFAATRPPDGRPAIIGAHLEGPFLGARPGAHPSQHIVPIDRAWLDALPEIVRLVTLAPEQRDATLAIERLVDRGVVVSIGHTSADADAVHAAIEAGAAMATHLFNAMSGLDHRAPGVAAEVLAPLDPDHTIAASLIADGVHVHPSMLRLAFRMLRDRAVLVTDAVAWQAARPGARELVIADGAPRLADGTLAGSCLTMDRAIRVCVDAGIELADACRAAGPSPAAVMRLVDRDAVRVGARADLVALDGRLDVEQTWRLGAPTLAG